MGAILRALVWTAVDSSGTGSLRARSVWTPLDTHGQGLEIYGSEGWGFESLRACYAKPMLRRGFRRVGASVSRWWPCRGSDPREPFFKR